MGIKFLIENTNGEMMDVFSYLKSLEKRIADLENENVGTTNALYEIENRIDMIAKTSYNEDEPPRMCGEMIFMDDEDEDV